MDADAAITTLRVLTLNCWGVWLGAKRRRQRMDGIVRFLRENNCDVVFLQEVWVTSDFEIIKNGTKDLYCFAHLFRASSVVGSSGIVILCKWYPKVIHFEPYSLNGSPFYPWHGDWFAGKGIAYSRVDFDDLCLHLFSTHTHAYYKEDEPIHDQYSVHRVCQSYQLAKFINFISDTASNRNPSHKGKDLLVVAGDMNSTSSELPYKILTTMSNLTDCFDSDTEEHEHITYCHPKNSFTPGALNKSLSSKSSSSSTTTNSSSSSSKHSSKKSPMKRIDFILCRLLSHGHCIADKIATESRDHTINCSLSDHEPVMVEFKICDIHNHDSIKKNNLIAPSCKEPEDCIKQVMNETRDILMQYHQYNRTSKTQLFYILLFLFVITLPTVTYYALLNELVPTSTIVFMWFAASVIFAIGLLVGFLSYRFEQGAIEAILNDMKIREKSLIFFSNSNNDDMLKEQ